MTVPLPAQLLNQIVQTKEHERAAGNSRKPTAVFIVQRNSEPGDEKAQDSGEKNMTASGQPGHEQRLRAIPFLDARGQDKRQPMRRNGSVEKGYSETSKRNCGKQCLIHAS